MGSKVASKEHFKIRTSGRKRGGRVSCAEEMGSFFSCLSKATGNANVTTVCASEISNLRNCAASVVRSWFVHVGRVAGGDPASTRRMPRL